MYTTDIIGDSFDNLTRLSQCVQVCAVSGVRGSETEVEGQLPIAAAELLSKFGRAARSSGQLKAATRKWQSRVNKPDGSLLGVSVESPQKHLPLDGVRITEVTTDNFTHPQNLTQQEISTHRKFLPYSGTFVG